MDTCADQELLTRFRINKLPRPEHEALNAHLATCESCRRQLELITPDATSTAGGLSADPMAPDGGGTGFRRFPRIDGYRIVREVGRGGMGIVYEAVEEKLSRRVALKILPTTAMHEASQVRRFEREAQAAARLHHPNIVPVFGVSRHDEQPYFVMQYIEGSGLDRVLAELRRLRNSAPVRGRSAAGHPADRPGGDGAADLPRGPVHLDAAAVARSLASGTFRAGNGHDEEGSATDDGSAATAVFPPPVVSDDRRRADSQSLVLPGSTEISSHSEPNRPYFEAVAKIGVQVAEALEYAHRQGVLHRDIKPSNLLLDTQANVWVADFGLAKMTETGDLTRSGQLVGTTRYMAPERFQGLCDARSDVYSLGLTLYELAALRPAFEGSDRVELVERIRHEEPARLKKLEPRVPQDLETIIHKAIAGERGRRYQSAHDLGADLRRFLEDVPIKARRVSHVERVVRWCRRNPWATASIALLVVGTVVSLWQAIRATRAEQTARSAALATIDALNRVQSAAIRAREAEAATAKERDRAEAEAEISRTVRNFVQQDLLAQASAYNHASLLSRPDPDLKVRTALDRAAEKIGDRFTGQPLVEASIRQTVGETYYQLGLFREALPHLRRSLELRQSHLVPDDPERLAAMKALGVVYLADGKLDQAGPLLVGAMEGFQKGRLAEDPDLLDAMTFVADLYYIQQKYAEAERLLAPVRRAHLKKSGPDDPRTLDATNSLAMVYLEQKKPQLAEETLTDVLKRFEKTRGIQHPMTLLVKQNLSDIYQRRGKHLEAVRLLNEAIEGQTTAIGRNHPDTLRSLVKLGMLDAALGRFDDAEPLLKEALKECRKALDRNHETTVGALAGLSVVYVSKRDMKQLGEALTEAAEITRIRYGVDDGLTAAANQSAAMFHFVMRDYPRAEPYFRDRLTHLVKHGPGERARYSDELLYGVCLLAQRKDQEAQAHLFLGYNGLRPDRPEFPALEHVDLGHLIGHVLQLPEASGQPFGKSSLSVVHKDPRLEGIVLDLQFPAESFVSPIRAQSNPRPPGGLAGSPGPRPANRDRRDTD
jgi:eukaryotic-like serine/threonine-protein kinase